jgi:hypothetical protein
MLEEARTPGEVRHLPFTWPEEPKKGLYIGGERPSAARPEHEWKLVCLDFASGKVRWERVVHRGPPPEPIHLKNSYASETPCTDGERVYFYFGNVVGRSLQEGLHAETGKPLNNHAKRAVRHPNHLRDQAVVPIW